MPLIIPPGFAQIVYQFSSPNFLSGGAVTTFGAGSEGGPFVPNATVAEVARDAWQENISPITHLATTLASVRVTSFDDYYELAVGVTGLASGNFLPPNAALLSRKLTTGRGRRRQGRMFWPSVLLEADVDNAGIIGSGVIGGYRAAVQGWYEDVLEGLDNPLVILQNSEGVTPPISPPPVVSGILTENRIATQRRRLRR